MRRYPNLKPIPFISLNRHLIKLICLIFSTAFLSMLHASDGSQSHQEETARKRMATAVQVLVEPGEEESVLARLQRLALTPMPQPAILNELMLSTPNQHVDFLKAALSVARSRVIIVSPYISIYRLNEDDSSSFYQDIKSAAQRGIEIVVFTDAEFDANKQNAEEGRKNLVKAQANLRIVDRIHSKNLIIDNTIITFGSFNWLSAVINPRSSYCRYETSTVIKDQSAPALIQRFLVEVSAIPLIDREGYHAFYQEYSPIIGDLKATIVLHRKYATHPLYQLVTREMMYSHLNSELRESFAVVSVLKETGEPKQSLVHAIKSIYEFRIGDAMEFIDVLDLLANIDKEEAKRAAADKSNGILSRINRVNDFEHLDSIWSFLNRIGLKELANKVEMYIHTGKEDS